jgi:NAD(P)H-dependent FMN reductase
MPEYSDLTIPVLLGTIRLGRRSAGVARLVLRELQDRKGIATELIDLADLDLPVMRYRLGESPSDPPGASALATKLTRADGLLIVGPEYKNGYPGSLKNALDYLPAGMLRRKPVGIVTVSSGGFGGLNCLVQLRLVCLAIWGVPIPVACPVSSVESAVDEQGNAVDPRVQSRCAQLINELLWYTRAIANASANG